MNERAIASAYIADGDATVILAAAGAEVGPAHAPPTSALAAS
jgi:hypothetical protein